MRISDWSSDVCSSDLDRAQDEDDRLAGWRGTREGRRGDCVMKVRAQIAMVMNLDKCIGCHTCSITCKNVWTSREGVEYAWFNNVETKPGVGYPKEWERSEERRVGKECGRTCRYRLSPYH